MYKEHVPLLTKAGLGNYDKFADIVTFALLSVRQPFLRVPEQFADVKRKGAKSPFLWGWKEQGFTFLQRYEEGRPIWEKVKESFGPAEAIAELVAVPGLGIAKAGFVAQMLGFNVACFDSRNMRKIGGDERRWRWDSDYSKGNLEYKIQEYVALSQEKGAEYWWNSWCEDVARDNYETAERVSAMHLAAIGKWKG